MRLVKMAPVTAAVALFCALRAGASLELDLENTWRNAMPSGPGKMPGDVTWVSITFTSNSVARWEWVRDGKTETHSGTFEMSVRPVPGGRSTISDIVIAPATLAVEKPLVLHGATIRNDNRFPALWVVLKWFDDAGNQHTFVRDSEYGEWKEFMDLLDKADKAEKAAKQEKAATAHLSESGAEEAAGGTPPAAGKARGDASLNMK